MGYLSDIGVIVTNSWKLERKETAKIEKSVCK